MVGGHNLPEVPLEGPAVDASPSTPPAKMEGNEVDEPEYLPPKHIPFFRSTICQILIVGGVFFCAPGMYNAESNLGAGGLATPYWANATAAAGYVFMAVMCVWGGVVVSKIGVRWSLLISSTGDILYSGSLYQNSAYGTQWFLMLGSILSGCTDGLMYAVEGPIITAYPEQHRRGKMLGLWVFMRSAAPVVGGAIIFGLNHSTNSSGGVSLKTYLVLIGIMCAGPFIALLLSPPEKVMRKDGKPIQFRRTGFVQATKEWTKVVMSPQILLFLPFFFTSWFAGSYTGTLQTLYFDVRTRSLMALILPFFDIAGGFLTGHLLDVKRWKNSSKARWSFGLLVALNLILWVWIAIVTKQVEDQNPIIDWVDHGWMGKLCVNLFLFEFCTMATQTALYWMVSFLSDDFNSLSYITGTLRGVECCGQALAFGIKASNTSNWASVGLNIGLIVFSVPFAWQVVRTIGVRDYLGKERPEEILHSVTGAAAPTQSTVPAPNVLEKRAEAAADDSYADEKA